VRRLLALLAVPAVLLGGATAQAAFAPGEEVTYSADGANRTGVVIVKAGERDLYLVSVDGSESTQYVLPGSRLTLRDRDADGVPDSADECPTQPGPAPSGCPPPPSDRDGDGVPDVGDACPDQAGSEPNGCPPAPPPAPTASFAFSPANPETNQPVALDAGGSTCPASPCTYAWDDVTSGVMPLGNGQTNQASWSAAGTRQVRLTVTDRLGRASQSTRGITVVVADCAGRYLARYWPNRTMSGTPALTRCEATVDNNFVNGSPPGLPADGFSARYDGRIHFAAGDHRFELGGDDGVRLWVDGQLVIDKWVNQAFTTYSATRTLTAGVHDVRVEYYEAGGAARVRLAISAMAPPPDPNGPMTLRQVDGGPGFYGQFANGLPSGPDFFPIGVWFESVLEQADVDKDKAAGLNTYMRLTGGSNLGLVRSNGMYAFNSNGMSGVGAETRGWITEDEPDMWAGPGSDAWTGSWTGPVCNPPVTQGGKCGYTVLETINNQLPDDGRARYSNYGKGVAFWETDAQAARFLNGTASFGPYQDIVSTDIYFFTDGALCIPSQAAGQQGVVTANNCHVAANYGWLIDKQRRLISPAGSRPVWAFIEVGHPFSEGHWPSITPNEIKAAVWHSLIAGARGVIYFNHSFGGPCISHHALREPCYAAVRAAVTETNARIKALAPVLNAPSVDHLVASSPGVRTMAKWQGGKFYVFAGNRGANAVSTTFDLPCVGNATATVVDESRQIPVVNGKFSDQFADGNAIHIYRIDGGSTCGLS
jgi:hypothetical protein